VEIATSFLRSAARHLMFIAADIGFVAQNVVALLALWFSDARRRESGCLSAQDRLSGTSSPTVAAGITDAASLSVLTSPLVFHPLDQAAGKVPFGEQLEVAQVATGSMLIPRRTSERFKQYYPKITLWIGWPDGSRRPAWAHTVFRGRHRPEDPP
jgi:hypothetical protein